jgi:outer membrane protein
MHSKFASLVLTTTVAAFALDASADTVFGVYAGAGTWLQKASGDVMSGDASVDLDKDLGLDDEQNNVFFLALEHPVPLLPNVRLQYMDIGFSGSSTLNREIDFNGATFPITTAVKTDIQATQTAATLYYEMLDNVVSLDLGLDVRYLDGDASIVSTIEASRVQFKGAIALPYARARVDLPFSGFWLGGEISGIAYGGDSVFDANAQLGWQSAFGLGMEAGYRTFRLNAENFDDIDKLDVAIDGPYAGLNFHF